MDTARTADGEIASAEASEASDGVTGEGAQQLLRIRLTFAVERWPGSGTTLYGASLGVFLAILRITPLAGSSNHMAHAEAIIALSDTRLAVALSKAVSVAQQAPLEVAAHPARLLDYEIREQTTFASLLDAPRPQMQSGQTIQWVRFITPTTFSWGRGVDGRHRYGLLPAPEHVVGSWLRAWNAGGGPPLPFDGADDWLRERIRVHAIRSLRTVQAHTGKTPITGFIGEVAYEWCGDIPGGHRALRALAGFARYSGTGSKTAYGLGQTET